MKFLGVVALLVLQTGVANGTPVAVQSEGHVQNPTWSNDGEWLAFEVNNLSNSVELWIAQVNGGRVQDSKQVRIPGATRSFGGGSSSVVAAPSWTSVPSTMAFFEGSNAGGLLRLYYALPGSASPNELITMDSVSGNITAPTVSGNGARFAFTADVSGNGDIYVWDLAGGGAPMVASPTSASENLPSFDEQGERIVFSRNGDGEDVYWWDRQDNSGLIAGGVGDQTRPVWIGDQIAYFSSSRGEGHWDIRVSGATGGRSNTVARDVRLPVRARPAATPDGTAVAWASADPDSSGVIMVSKLDGSGSISISTGLVACAEPSLVSVGGRVWLAFTALPAEGSDWRKLHIIDVTGQL